MKKLVLFVVLSIVTNGIAFAQLAKSSKAELNNKAARPQNEYVYRQDVPPQGMDNYLFSLYHYNGKKTYNLRNLVLSTSSGIVKSLKINPSGSSFAVLTQKGDKSEVCIYDLWKAKRVLHEFKEVVNPTAVAYTSDARQIILAHEQELLFFDARTFELMKRMDMPFKVDKMVVSSNNYFLAASDGQNVSVWNMENGNLRKEFNFDTSVNSFDFSDDCSMFALLTEDGLLSTYDTAQFFILQSYDAVGDALHCSFHPDGKYISVVSGPSRIAILNLMDDEEREYIDNVNEGITEALFVKDGKEQIFLAYNTTNSITYKLMSELAPFYTKLLEDELETRMNEWMKQMPNETLEEYNLRVTEENRKKQMRLFEDEIATRMAENLVQMSEITLGNYNPDSHMLAVNFDNMPTIYLEVPSDEINDFTSPQNLEFRNTKYGLTKKDKFELIYADIYNNMSGKTYTFNNLERQSLDFLKSDDKFVPLEVVLQSNMEELKLQEIKDNIVGLAKQKNTISDHTNISVNAKVVSDIDADGNKMMNYIIDFSYQVEKGFSGQEDFGPGKFKVEESGAALSMLDIIKTAFETEFAPYVKEGKKLIVKTTGMADALPIHRKIAYDGCYGDFVNEPIYKNNDLSNITVTQADGITENEQLAFLRAVGMEKHITMNIPSFSTMNTDYRHYIKLTEGKGGEYRRISVELTFVGAF